MLLLHTILYKGVLFSGFGYQYDNEELSLVREYEFDHDLLAMSRVFERGVNKYLIAAKGAPEAIMDLCHLSDKKMAELRLEIDKMANKGLRIIGLAKSEFSKKKAATSQHDYDFKFVGFLGLSDPIRPEIPESIKVCYEAGIRVIMITGDYPLTAINIAQQIGLNNYQQVISGQELEKLSDSELSEKVKVTNIFARIIPAQKLRIVNALKSNGEVVAMTGDGVNDAPALKAADIGVSMGERGTDVAREASSLVLMDDNFSSIVAAVKMGRRIYENIRKAITYVFSIHIPIAIMSFIPPIFGMPLVLLPMHIVFMEMLIDPSCSIVFEMEKEEADIMKRKPRSGKEKLFNKKMILTGSFQGLSVLILVLLIYVIAVYKGLDDNTVRTIAFITLTVGNVGLVFTNRSDKNIFVTANRSVNKAFISVSVFATIFLLLTVYVPYLRDIFQFAILPWYLWAWPVVFGLVGVFLAEWFRLQIIKHFSRVDAL